MAFNRTKRNIAALQKSPEHARLSAASRLIIVIGGALIILWLLVLLPLQIFITGFFSDLNQPDQFPAVEQESDTPAE